MGMERQILSPTDRTNEAICTDNHDFAPAIKNFHCEYCKSLIARVKSYDYSFITFIFMAK